MGLSGGRDRDRLRRGGARGGGWSAAACVTGLLALAACGGPLGAVTPATATTGAGASGAATLPAFYRTPVDLAVAPAGSVIRSEAIAAGPSLPAGTRAYRVLYHSRSIDGSDLVVSGMVVVPPGAPPPGGFPVVGFAHGTTGLSDRCAPSAVGVGTIPDLAGLIAERTVVAATDYQGLGTSGPHPYLVGLSEGQSVLDSVRAARSLLGAAASNSVVLLGYSQGGQAVLFAGQIAADYAPELFIAGVAAVAPVSSLGALVPDDPAAAPDGDAGFAAMAAVSWSETYGNVDLAEVLTPLGRRDANTLTGGCVASSTERSTRSPQTRCSGPAGWSYRGSGPTTMPTDPDSNRPTHRCWWSRERLTPWSATPPPPGWSTNSSATTSTIRSTTGRCRAPATAA